MNKEIKQEFELIKNKLLNIEENINLLFKLDKPIRIIIEDNNNKKVEEQKIKTTDKKISGIIVDTKVQPKEKNKTINKVKGKKPLLDEYLLSHQNEYFIENLDEFYKNIYLIDKPYRLTKQQVATLINIILKCETQEKCIKELGCAKSTFGKYMSNLTKLGILDGNYKYGINLNNKLVIKNDG